MSLYNTKIEKIMVNLSKILQNIDLNFLTFTIYFIDSNILNKENIEIIKLEQNNSIENDFLHAYFDKISDKPCYIKFNSKYYPLDIQKISEINFNIESIYDFIEIEVFKIKSENCKIPIIDNLHHFFEGKTLKG